MFVVSRFSVEVEKFFFVSDPAAGGSRRKSAVKFQESGCNRFGNFFGEVNFDRHIFGEARAIVVEV